MRQLARIAGIKSATAVLIGMISSGIIYAVLAMISSVGLGILGPPEKTAWLILVVVAPLALLIGGTIVGRVVTLGESSLPSWKRTILLTPGLYICIFLVIVGMRAWWFFPPIVLISAIGTYVGFMFSRRKSNQRSATV